MKEQVYKTFSDSKHKNTLHEQYNTTTTSSQTYNNPQTLNTSEGIKCTQSDTIQRIFELNKQTRQQQTIDKEEIIQRDEKLKEAFDIVLGEVKELRQDLEERKLINNFNKEEKERLSQLLEKQGTHGEETEKEVNNYIRRLTSLESMVKLLLIILPILFSVFIAINGIALYTLLQHLAVT